MVRELNANKMILSSFKAWSSSKAQVRVETEFTPLVFAVTIGLGIPAFWVIFIAPPTQGWQL